MQRGGKRVVNERKMAKDEAGGGCESGHFGDIKHNERKSIKGLGNRMFLRNRPSWLLDAEQPSFRRLELSSCRGATDFHWLDQ